MWFAMLAHDSLRRLSFSVWTRGVRSVRSELGGNPARMILRRTVPEWHLTDVDVVDVAVFYTALTQLQLQLQQRRPTMRGSVLMYSDLMRVLTE